MIETLLNYDKELFLFLNNLGTPTWDNLWLIITNKFTFFPLYALLLFFIYKRLGLKTMLISIVVIALMITFTDQITNAFKHGFKRLRPCWEEGVKEHMRYIASRSGRYGFFSGHASNSMAAAVFAGLVLRPYYRKLIFILLFWSALVAYSRIYVGVHYPLDIVCGLSFGGFAGFLFYRIQDVIRNKFLSV